MRTILLILLASTAALALSAALVRPHLPRTAAAHPGEPMSAAQSQARRLLAAAALRPVRGLGFAPPAAAPPLAGIALPLIERSLPASRRAEPLEPQLIEAMDRIEPMLDPTRMDGPFAPQAFQIFPGTASLVDAFGEHWRLASDDPNVQRRVRAYGLAWHFAGPLACDDYSKNRPHAADEPALTTLTAADCARLHRRDRGQADAAPVPVVVAPLSLAVFAAPFPGARMSSDDFWAAQRGRIAAAQHRLQRRWQAARAASGEGAATGSHD